MKISLTIAILLVLQLTLPAQIVVRKDGSEVTGKPSVQYREPDSVIVAVDDQKIPASEVYGFIPKSKDHFLYFIPVSNPDARRIEWDFRQRSMEGEISLYVWTNSEKGIEQKVIMGQRAGQFGFLYLDHIDTQTAKEMSARLASWTQDEPSLAGALDSLSKQRSFGGVMAFVKRYNMKKYSPKEMKGALAQVVFFARPTLKLYTFSIAPDGGARYAMSMKSPLQLSLNHDQLTRVCVNTGEFQDCILIGATACCRQYVLVSMDPKKEGLVLTFSNEDVATRYITQEQSR